MRIGRLVLACVAVLMAFTHAASAQRRNVASANGAWRQVEIRRRHPDSTVMVPPVSGIRIIYNGYFSQIFYPTSLAQPARPLSADEKAARYDAVTTNAGHFEMTDDSTWAVHFDFAKVPATIGTTVIAHYRIAGDSLWETTTVPWTKDTTKTVRTTSKYVRMK